MPHASILTSPTTRVSQSEEEMPDTRQLLEEIADKLERRAAGDLNAAEDIWAEEMVIWHSFDDREQRIPGDLRGAHSRAKLEGMHNAMPDFKRTVTYYLSASTSVVIELTRWSGTIENVPDPAGTRSVSIDHKSVTIYNVDLNGRVWRMDILDDPASSRATAELTAYGGMPTVTTRV
jgi:hypothetical protein